MFEHILYVLPVAGMPPAAHTRISGGGGTVCGRRVADLDSIP